MPSSTLMKCKKSQTTSLPFIKKGMMYILVYSYGAVTLFPLLWVLISSFKENFEIMESPWALPGKWLFSNYREVWLTAKMSNFFMNSVFYSISSVVLSIILCSMAAYAITRLKIKFGNLMYVYLISGIMIPMNSLLVPIYLQIMNMKLLDSRLTLITIYVTFTIPFTIALTTANMKSIPVEMEEAAVIDGCGVIRNFVSIILPMSKPIIATVAILNFLTCWNEFIFAMLFTSSDKLRTLPVGLANFRGQYQTDYSSMFVGMVIAMIPVITIFIFMQERVVKGITAGSVKG